VYLNHSVLVVYIHSSDLVVLLTRVRLVFVSLGFSFYLIRVICSLWSLECHSPPKSPEYDIDRPKSKVNFLQMHICRHVQFVSSHGESHGKKNWTSKPMDIHIT
jgi:hypothetical protein